MQPGGPLPPALPAFIMRVENEESQRRKLLKVQDKKLEKDKNEK